MMKIESLNMVNLDIGKYLYNKEDLTDMKEFFMENLKSTFPNSIVKYII